MWFVQLAVTVGVDVVIPDASGCRWRDVLAAVELATSAIAGRFGTAGILDAVTPQQVVVAASGGRFLAPGWPQTGGATPLAPAAGLDIR